MADQACRITSDVSALHQRMYDLEAWQTRQNGTLQRLEDKLDRITNWIMGAMFTSLVALIGGTVAAVLKK